MDELDRMKAAFDRVKEFTEISLNEQAHWLVLRQSVEKYLELVKHLGQSPIQITPEMLREGVDTLCEHKFGEPWTNVVEAVYLMMELERRSEEDKP